MAGTFFGFANDNVANEKIEATPVATVNEVKADNENGAEDEDFATCLRCVSRTVTETNTVTGETSTYSVGFCHEVPCI
ncbi:hypothetical protein ACFQO9_03860 [Chryseobacterium zhengzhouense]|uniref:Uncharacterized protein n=1 Tax=Chryseobacterium zhengzhouense TaxID=1636086 RepID=A0ABW2LTP3_9FLAO